MKQLNEKVAIVTGAGHGIVKWARRSSGVLFCKISDMRL